jgi:ankyrin repeat protein
LSVAGGTTSKSLTDPRGATPLHYAAANGKLDVCEILVAGMGSEMIYHTDNGKCSPLHRALYRRRAATITYLIQLNADIDTPDNNGNNCLDLLYKQNPKDIEFIISKLETDCVDNRGQYDISSHFPYPQLKFHRHLTSHWPLHSEEV